MSDHGIPERDRDTRRRTGRQRGPAWTDGQGVPAGFR